MSYICFGVSSQPTSCIAFPFIFSISGRSHIPSSALALPAKRVRIVSIAKNLFIVCY